MLFSIVVGFVEHVSEIGKKVVAIRAVDDLGGFGNGVVPILAGQVNAQQ